MAVESAQPAVDIKKPAVEGQPPARLASLDAFRGLTILGMLLVNNIALGPNTPRHLTHAAWNGGVHFADLVFPWFLFIVGAAIPFSSASHDAKGLPWWGFYDRAFRRAVWLILLGCLIDSSLAKRPLFDLGVLQIIGLAYLVGALLHSLRMPYRLSVAGVFLLAHWAAIRFVSVPGIGAGVFDENSNLINYLNGLYLAPLHLKGLISVIPTSAMVLIGSAVGDLLRNERVGESRKTGYLVVSGLVLMGVGFLWNLDLPFNKPVWTASYILFSAGWGMLVLSVLYLLIDAGGWKAWSFPLLVFGSNAIVAYVAPILTKLHILHVWTWKMPDGNILPLQQAFLQYLKTETGPVAGGWLYTASYIIFWWLVLLCLYRKKLFLRL